MRKVWVCGDCGHEWFTREYPKRCAKCKSRKWNFGTGAGVEASMENPVMARPEKTQKDVESVSTGSEVVARPRKSSGTEKISEISEKPPILRTRQDSSVPDSNAARHDVKTCRIYRCGLCTAMGHKDSHRGV